MKKTLRITFKGKTYDVVAELLDDEAKVTPLRPTLQPTAAPVTPKAPPPAPSPAPVARPITPTPKTEGDLPSPLAGKVVSIDAPVGTAVKAGQTVVTLEAMKMNTTVPAPADGTVSAVHVNPGDAVDEGQVLLSIN